MLTAASPIRSSRQPAKAATPLVLVVEDHDDTRQMLRYLIEMNGCQVVEASDGDEAVRLAESMSPNLILMDAGLPKIDGLRATQQIRRHTRLRDVTIIFLSGYAQPQARDVALAAGASHYLVKPIDFDELKIALEKYLLRAAPSAKK